MTVLSWWLDFEVEIRRKGLQPREQHAVHQQTQIAMEPYRGPMRHYPTLQGPTGPYSCHQGLLM